MGCLIELILRRREQKFPSHRIIGYSVETTREQAPVFTMGSRSPMYFSPGRTYTTMTIGLSELTFEEFKFINDAMTNGGTVGPIIIRDYNDGRTAEFHGAISSGSGNSDGSATIELNVSQINVIQRGDTLWRAS